MLKYKSGEEILPGDRVVYTGVSAEVDFVVASRCGDPGRDWYVDQFGPGAMLTDEHVFGSVYVTGDELIEELVFVSRAHQD